jgi:CBS domain-containing protein
MLVEHLRAVTSSRLVVIADDADLHVAARWLTSRDIGLVVVCDGDGDGGAAGVLSKSDLVRHLARPAGPAPSVSALMSRVIVSCTPHDDLHGVWQIMATRKLQNIPVVEVRARPVGVLDIRDAMNALFTEEESQARALFNYVSGVGYR